ncbi:MULTISPECIES: hypothetical protein [Methanobrevibacter]|uniref:Uncharacterized protein n=1 Tax=Methanobrevibacter gottschalkii DSM 11977 TaxID=1122229 RepID=A0A3N5B3H5_9EURY|nr:MULTISPECIES: hypothetical protein [Methanobrevibacter]OEC94544.1 hypothetical protein A9505_08435 [Methanobrevibacter sp. A27]RPF51847.1 hypothetical protein EDC42_1188 [Methanobrevibacter gottschalkii DSM 11977]
MEKYYESIMKNLEIYRNIANFVSNFNIYGTSEGKYLIILWQKTVGLKTEKSHNKLAVPKL